MTLARVIGTVVATRKLPVLEGYKLLLFRAEDGNGQPRGAAQIGLDMVQAGPGDRVLVMDEGNSARQILGDATAPVRTVIVGIVDEVQR